LALFSSKQLVNLIFVLLVRATEKMFIKSAQYYDAIYHFQDYASASRKIYALVQQHNPKAETLLDVACGTGRHLKHLREYYYVEGIDINQDLLEIARQRCPEVPYHQGDMVNFKLQRTFDVVTCLFSAIGYVKTIENMYQTVANMTHHLRQGGMLIIEPWFTPESYWVGKLTANFVDKSDLKIAWMYISEIKDKVSILDISFMVGTPQGIEHFQERHEIGLYTHDEYMDAFYKSGLDVICDSKGLFGRSLYVGLKNKKE
jgi:ubiquinone/menaquinone biosynthesis C-methylase UbiE